MRNIRFIALCILPLLAACASETPIRKTNCWSTMALLPMDDCEFEYVPAVRK